METDCGCGAIYAAAVRRVGTLTSRSGPLEGIRVVEFAALGPVPFTGMLLADMGATVDRVDRPNLSPEEIEGIRSNALNRGRRSITLDLKADSGRMTAQYMMNRSDVVLEGYRPGVMERLGLDPAECMRKNPALVFARMTGWGQSGPYARQGGHDINFVGLSGVLDSIGTDDSGPVPPLMYLGDFAGGGMLLAYGVVSALLERAQSGQGQVLDASVLEGTALLSTSIHDALSRGKWRPERGTNAYDTGSHFYNVYATRDGKYMAVGAIEPQFYLRFLEVIGLDPTELPDQGDRTAWPSLKARIAEIFRSRDQADWVAAFKDVDACVTPVLSLPAAVEDEHCSARQTFVNVNGRDLPGPTPRLSRTPGRVADEPPRPGRDTGEILMELGIEAEMSS